MFEHDDTHEYCNTLALGSRVDHASCSTPCIRDIKVLKYWNFRTIGRGFLEKTTGGLEVLP
jgi:hypothetical protein